MNCHPLCRGGGPSAVTCQGRPGPHGACSHVAETDTKQTMHKRLSFYLSLPFLTHSRQVRAWGLGRGGGCCHQAQPDASAFSPVANHQPHGLGEALWSQVTVGAIQGGKLSCHALPFQAGLAWATAAALGPSFGESELARPSCHTGKQRSDKSGLHLGVSHVRGGPPQTACVVDDTC